MSETGIVNKLDVIEKRLQQNGKVTQMSIGFAITAFMSNSIASPDGTMNRLALIFSILAGLWFLWNGFQWLLSFRK
jgi:hypothetical protein